jgi:UDP-N-acetylmuramyl-tripeptide synthetase
VKLSNLLKVVELKNDPGTGNNGIAVSDPEIASIHYRAQEVKPGGLFAAVQGFTADGHDFIDDALANGASAVFSERAVKKDPRIVAVENSRKALAAAAARFFGDPSENLVLIGVTGTNGKTTVSYLIESILSKAGIPTGVIGTINYRYGGEAFLNSVTTPESLDLQRIFAEMLGIGVTHVVMEVSSHALSLFRVHGCRFDVGVFTNLTQDHLDFHKDMDAYWGCKKRLFTEHLGRSPKKDRARAVINCDDKRGRALSEMLSIPVVTTGRSEGCMIRPESVFFSREGLFGKIATPSGVFDVSSPLVGEHNMENILSATGAGTALKISNSLIKDGIEAISSVPGRLERIANTVDRFVYVDYAHTPDALENVLLSLRRLAEQRIICIFGCGGDRDRDKRPRMGEIAAVHSDLCVITSDNPRTEPSMEIIDQILRGIRKADLCEYSPGDIKEGFKAKGYVIEADRKDAICLGIMVSRSGDTILIAGKGHETHQITGNRRKLFDDRQEAKNALRKIGGIT